MNEILKDLQTPEGKAILEKCVEEYIAKIKVRNKKIKSMMSNTEYLEWLDEFTKDKNRFCDDAWLYCPEKISDSDRENVEKLCLFYEGIKEYAIENYIYPTSCDFGEYYKVKLNDFCFKIGILFRQTVFFFDKTLIENEKELIDFKDVMIGKKQDNVDKINATLKSLSSEVMAAYESGVPIKAIVDTLENIIEEISKKKDKPKTLVIK